MWKGRTMHLMSMVLMVGLRGKRMPNQKDVLPQVIICASWWMRLIVSLLCQASTQPWTEIRYAEVLLNHAEACYHLSGYADKANKDIEDIRNRVGLPYSDKSGEDLMKAIRQERKVELAYEGHYYWDMRRWDYLQRHSPVSVFMDLR
ncbi:RagB/SusD family nutrient uptake outer membrane protein [Bacteroides thetaiotaomicron]|nr:RagB/SusD family nutrient uptake outer membrane protein [Bacteroides thetaiotaomicron]